MTRSGSLKSPPMMSFPPSADKVKPASRRGKKRKSGADSNSDFDISQFMDGQVSAGMASVSNSPLIKL